MSLAVGTRLGPYEIVSPLGAGGPAPHLTMFLGRGSSVAASPDGRTIVFAVTAAERTQLYVRSLDRLESTPLPDTNGASNPFFSPDGQWVGFTAGGKLKKLNLQAERS